MKFRILPKAFIIFFLCGLSLPSYAQQDQDAALLPDIDPQDIEIRGEFRARFPGLTRQPILGFDPSLRIYQVDPNREPFMESGDEVVANLPVSNLSRPEPPQYTGLTYNENINAVARAGFGSYSSPEAQFWGVFPINQQTYLGGDLDFSSSNGHLDSRPSSFRFLEANAEFGTKIDDKTELRVYAGGQNDFNYPVAFDASNVDEASRITHEGINGGIEVQRFKNDIAGWKLQANARSFNTSFEGSSFPGSISEITYNGSFANRWALGHPNETFAIKVGGRGGNYEPENADSQQWGTLQGGLAYERLFNYTTSLHAEADVYYATNAFEDNVYPGGLFQVDHWLGDRLKITGKVEGKPHLQAVEQLHERNRFLGYDNTLNHTYTIDVTGEAEIKYYRGSKLHGGVTYTNAQDYAYFLAETISNGTGEQLDTYSINYDNATNFKLFAGITHQLLPEKFWVSSQFYLQNPELNGGQQIPFEETWGVNASMSFRPIDRITIGGWADYMGERETGLNDETLSGFLLLGANLDVKVTDNIGAYIKGVNLLDEEYQVWKGYTERPLQVYGGLTLRF